MTGMTCLYVFFEGLFMRKIVVTKLTNVPVEMKVVIQIRSFKPKYQPHTLQKMPTHLNANLFSVE